MAEPLKNIFSRPLLTGFADDLHSIGSDFPRADFLSLVFDDHWEALALKERVRHISHALRAVLPPDYPTAVDVLVRCVGQYIARHGDKLTFEYIFLPDFIEVFGVEDPDTSLPAMETITRWSSAEFAVRPFLLRYPERMYAQMLVWSRHGSPMVRRLSSEGIRPRLPWGMGVPALKRDPSPILPILENLKNDPAETVRRSVANNLNDIAKEHPHLVLSIAERWQGLSPETDWVVRHACRGLLKKGNALALSRFGFGQDVGGLVLSDLWCSPSVAIGQKLDFGFTLRNESAQTHSVRLEYGIDYLTGTGKTSSKVFKIKEMEMSSGQSETIVKYQRFQDFTTRKHFPGEHRLYAIVNGQRLGEEAFRVLSFEF